MIRIRFRHWRRWLYRRVVKLRGSPHAIARGMALGVIFGNLMPPGLQLFTGIPVTLLLGGNVLAMIAGTCVSNPFTYVALYLFNCRVGEVFLNGLGAEISLGADLEAALRSVREMRIGEFFAERLRPLLSCWIAGGLLVGLAESVPAYYLMHIIVIQVRRLQSFARARRAARHEARAAEEKPRKTGEPDEEAPDEQPPPPPE